MVLSYAKNGVWYEQNSRILNLIFINSLVSLICRICEISHEFCHYLKNVHVPKINLVEATIIT